MLGGLVLSGAGGVVKECAEVYHTGPVGVEHFEYTALSPSTEGIFRQSQSSGPIGTTQAAYRAFLPAGPHSDHLFLQNAAELEFSQSLFAFPLAFKLISHGGGNVQLQFRGLAVRAVQGLAVGLMEVRGVFHNGQGHFLLVGFLGKTGLSQ